VNPQRLDHLALYVADPEEVARTLLSRLPFRVIEETDEFVLVGRSPELGKLTLFRADGPRERGSLVNIGIGIPCATASTTLVAGEGLDLELVPSAPDGEVDISHVALRVPDPVRSVRTWLAFGFERAGTVGPAERVRLGSTYLVLHPGPVEETRRPLLNHFGLLVESIDETRRAVANLGFEIEKETEGDESFALFVRGPDDVEVEYIEHKPSYALA
jgi:catechol 2,3-dioxygenase-like lactoylglutathione lyase family enzyme